MQKKLEVIDLKHEVTENKQWAKKIRYSFWEGKAEEICCGAPQPSGPCCSCWKQFGRLCNLSLNCFPSGFHLTFSINWSHIFSSFSWCVYHSSFVHLKMQQWIHEEMLIEGLWQECSCLWIIKWLTKEINSPTSISVQHKLFDTFFWYMHFLYIYGHPHPYLTETSHIYMRGKHRLPMPYFKIFFVIYSLIFL